MDFTDQVCIQLSAGVIAVNDDTICLDGIKGEVETILELQQCLFILQEIGTYKRRLRAGKGIKNKNGKEYKESAVYGHKTIRASIELVLIHQLFVEIEICLQ